MRDFLRRHGWWLCPVTFVWKAVDEIWSIPGRMSDTETWKGWIGETNMPPVDVSDWVLIGLFLVGATTWLWNRSERFGFDMPINAAIAHVLAHNPSTAIRRVDAEMKAFEGIFKEAKDGKIAIAGSPDEGVPPTRIPRCRLRRLIPRDMAIPLSEEAPEGHVYTLCGFTPKEFREYKRSETETYTNLLVKSREFHRLWPKTGEVEG